MKHIVFTALIAAAGTIACAQTSFQHAATSRTAAITDMIDFPEHERPAFMKEQVLLKQGDQLIPTDKVILKESGKDELGQEHFRYQQTINGVPVVNATYIVHVANGRILRENGTFADPDLAGQLPRQPFITAADAVVLAKQAVNAREYRSAVPDEPETELVYYTPEPDLSDLKLAYKVDVYATAPVSRDFIYIDALNGSVLGRHSRICTISYETKQSATMYNGVRQLGVRCTNAGQNKCDLYELRPATADTRTEIETLNLTNYTDPQLSGRFSLDNLSSKDSFALDAHWATEMFHDYFLKTYGRKSINNNNLRLRSYVHYGTNHFNAMWDGYVAFFGDGDYRNGFRPLTTLDIVAHEFSHGIVGYTAGLNYYSESGALNEGFADIFANEVEVYARGDTSGSWTIGEDFGAFRSMNNPALYGQPGKYQGDNWEFGTNDFAGVHRNSSVLNRWYYLLSQGDVNFAGIGRDKASKLAYRILSVYLTQNSGYYDAYQYSLQASSDLNYTAADRESLKAAWAAVDIPQRFTGSQGCEIEAPNDLSSTPQQLLRVVRARLESSGDVDWFRISAPNDKPNFKVVLNMENTNRNYSLKIYKANNLALLYSGKTKGSRTRSFTYNLGLNGGSYLVSVSGVKKAFNRGACYTISVSTSDQFLVPDDEDTSGADSTDNELIARYPSTGEDKMLRVAPNPASDKLTILFDNNTASATPVWITDMLGRIVKQARSNADHGQQYIPVDLDGLANGIYYVRAGTQTTRFIISR